jgi:hypothetical protein
VRRAALAASVLAVLLAGCGGSNKSQRPAVALYVNRVNTIESRLAKPLQTVTKAGSQFASNQGKAVGSLTSLSGLAEEQALLHALAQIHALRGQLAAIAPPPAAAHLRMLLLSLVDGEAGMTTELGQLVAFLPRFAAALTSLTPATNKLQSALAVSKPLGVGTAGVTAELAVKARALTAYEARLGAVLRRLGRLHPPPVSRPQYRTQIGTLRRMSAAAGNLAHGLATGSSNVAPLLQAFDSAAAGNQTLAAQRAQDAAIRAYDRRAKRLDTLAQDVEAERARLSTDLK